MEDDDEFGELYADVIRPFEAQFQPQEKECGLAAAAVEVASASQGRSVDLKFDSDDEKTSHLNTGTALGWNLNSSIREKTLHARSGFDLNLDANSEAAARIDGVVGKGGDGSDFEARVLENGHGLELRGTASGKLSFMDDDDDDINIIVEGREDNGEDLGEKGHNFMIKESKEYAHAVQEESNMNLVNDAAVDEMGPEQIIPRLSGRSENASAPYIEDEWHSEESDDDLQIVLNDNNHGPMMSDRMQGMIDDVDDEDDDGQPLVIAADNGDVGHHNHQEPRIMDEQCGGEEEGCEADTEKDLGDASKASGGGGEAGPAAAQTKNVYSNQSYHNPFSSQFKYVRPGAATFPGAAPGGITGQIRPPISMGPPAGRGRGYHPSYGILAGGVNVAGRRYATRLDFTLLSHKTIFEVDIDSFEEKPWKLPGIDVSDFFNFGLNEDGWRDYCKQLGQLRLEMAMQIRIRGHGSCRAEQNYHPELAAAVGIQDNPSENANHGKIDAGPDLARQTSLPIGRPIPVETGSSDRLPSIDTRRPRMHDMDTIIEIVCHSSMDGDDVSEQQGNDPAIKDHLGGGDETDGLQQDDADHMDSFSPDYNGNKREFESRRPVTKNIVLSDILREDVSHLPLEVNGHSRPDRETGLPHEERSTKGRMHVRSPFMSASENTREHIVGDLRGEQSPASSSSLSVGSDRERAVVVEDGKDSNTTRSNVSRARSGSSEYLQIFPDDVDDDVLQHSHSLRAGKNRREVGDDDNAHRKDRYDGEEAGRQNLVVKGRDCSFSRIGGDTNSSLHWHGKTESADWRKESDISEGTCKQRDEDHRGRRTRLEDPRNQDKSREREKSEKGEHHQSRNQLDNGSWRGTSYDYDIIGSRQRDRDDHPKIRSERVDDLRSTRRYEELHMRRVHAEKDDYSHNHIESSAGRKRERDDGSDQIKRDVHGKSKDDEVHYARKKGGSSRRERREKLREHDEWNRVKQDDHLSMRERVETCPVMRSALAAEEKTWISHSKGNVDYKGSSKEYHPKDVVWHGDLFKHRDRVENDFSQLRSHEDIYARRNQLTNDERRSRYNKPTSRDERVSYGPDTSRMRESKRKESSRKSGETDSGDHSSLTPPKRNQDEDGGSASEMANLSGRTEEHSGHGHIHIYHQSSRKHSDDSSTQGGGAPNWI